MLTLVRLICAICSVSRQEASEPERPRRLPPAQHEGALKSPHFHRLVGMLITPKPNSLQVYRFVRDSKKTKRRRRSSVSQLVINGTAEGH